MNRPFIIGVAGGSGSGKTFFLKCFKQHFDPDEICVVSQDDYYRHVSDTMTREENKLYNFDLPETIDDEHFVSDIHRLINGNPVQKVEYTFHNAAVTPKQLEIKPAQILIIEGLFIFHFREILKLLNLKLFLEAENGIAFQRRVDRDLPERGYSYDDVLYKWVNHVGPAYAEYLLPYRAKADRIITNNSNITADMLAVTSAIAQQVKARL